VNGAAAGSGQASAGNGAPSGTVCAGEERPRQGPKPKRREGGRGVRAPHLAPPLLVHLVKLRKVALVLVQLVVMEVDDVGRHGVQEVPVAHAPGSAGGGDPVAKCTAPCGQRRGGDPVARAWTQAYHLRPLSISTLYASTIISMSH